MLMDEYDEAKALNMSRQEGLKEGREEGLKEGRDEGLKEGREEGKIKTLALLVKDGDITIEKAAEKAGMTKSEFLHAVKMLPPANTPNDMP